MGGRKCACTGHAAADASWSIAAPCVPAGVENAPSFGPSELRRRLIPVQLDLDRRAGDPILANH
jgi:hypothetical protein